MAAGGREASNEQPDQPGDARTYHPICSITIVLFVKGGVGAR